MKIALLGAESTGKTQLAQALAQHWQQKGQSVTVVSETLREWCDQHGRTPRASEQLGIAHQQAQRVLDAPSAQWLVADTTPLMVAVYSDMLFDDPSLYDFALSHQQHYDITLLTGLDLPWVADGLQRDGPHVREPVDARVRAALARGGIAHKVIYGQGEARLANALFAIESAAASSTSPWANSRKDAQSRPWTCRDCSDPACEHRLFTGLWASPEAGLADR